MTPCTSIRVCATLATLALLGCASAKERAQESLQAGNYDDAIQRYERIVSRDAGDAEAVSGLRDARSGWLGQKLIQARMSRMAGNTNEALDFLMETVNRENSWKMAPGGKVAFTQEEESGFAWPTFVARVQSLLKEKHPLRAEILLRKYEPAFQGRPKTELASVHTAVRRGGKNSCLSLKNERMRDKPYFARFVSTYCQFWSEGGAKADSISDTLYGDTQIAVAGDGIGAETQGMVRTAVQKSFAQTAWYDARGKLKLEGKVDGQFSQSKNKTGLVLIQTYMENENYVETVPVEKHRQVAQQVLHQVVDPNTHLLQNIETTELKSESYWEQEPQTRTRQVEKNYRYPAWKHEQSLALALNGQFRLAGRNLDISYSEKSNTDGIEHDENQPAMGLKPSRPNIPEPTAWTRAQVDRFAAQFQEKAAKLWSDSFCQPDASAQSVGEVGNRVMMCLHQPSSEVPKFAEEWYQAELGLGVRETSELLAHP